MATMRQWTLTHLKSFDGLAYSTSAAVPELFSPTSIRIAIKAIALNARDLQIASSLYPAPVELPDGGLVPVSDACGVVEAVGKGVTRFKVGDKVCPIIMQGHTSERENNHTDRALGGPLNGVATDLFVCDQADAVLAPERLSFEEAACLPIAYVTVWAVLYNWAPTLASGQTLLVLGTGGCAMAALQIAKAAGCRVIVTSSSDTKLEVAKSLGADDTINYRSTPAYDEEVKKLTNGRGVDWVLETAGGDTLARSCRSCVKGGVVGVIGYLSDYAPKTTEPEDMAKVILYTQTQVKGVLIGGRDCFEALNRATQLASWKPPIDKVFNFEQLREAYDHLASGSMIGKVVITL